MLKTDDSLSAGGSAVRKRELRSSLLSEFSSKAIAVSIAIYYFIMVFLFVGPLQVYAYYGTYDLHVNIVKLLVGLVLVYAGGAILPHDNTPRALFFWGLLYVAIIPRFVQFGCRDDSWLYPLACFATFHIAVYLGERIRIPAIGKQKATKQEDSQIFFLMVMFASLTIAVCYLLLRNGSPLFGAFDFGQTYDIRSSNSFTAFESALIMLIGAFVNPFFICFLLALRRSALAILASICEMLLFMWTANKGWLFMLVLIWLIWLFYRLGYLTVSTIAMALTVLVCIIALQYIIFGEGFGFMLFSLFIRRALFVPSTLGVEYFHFFGDHTIVLLQNTVLGILTPMPDEYSTMEYQTQISLYAWGESRASWANTGLFGGEFANFGQLFGWFSIMVNLILFSIVFRLSRSECCDAFLSLSALLFANSLLNASSIRILFSYSGLFTMFLVILMIRFCNLEIRRANNNLKRAY